MLIVPNRSHITYYRWYVTNFVIKGYLKLEDDFLIFLRNDIQKRTWLIIFRVACKSEKHLPFRLTSWTGCFPYCQFYRLFPLAFCILEKNVFLSMIPSLRRQRVANNRSTTAGSLSNLLSLCLCKSSPGFSFEWVKTKWKITKIGNNNKKFNQNNQSFVINHLLLKFLKGWVMTVANSSGSHDRLP